MRTVVMKGRMKLEICNVLHVRRNNSGIIACYHITLKQ